MVPRDFDSRDDCDDREASVLKEDFRYFHFMKDGMQCYAGAYEEALVCLGVKGKSSPKPLLGFL